MRRYVTLRGDDGQVVTAVEGSTIHVDIPVKINTASDSKWEIKGYMNVTWKAQVVEITTGKRWWQR